MPEVTVTSTPITPAADITSGLGAADVAIPALTAADIAAATGTPPSPNYPAATTSSAIADALKKLLGTSAAGASAGQGTAGAGGTRFGQGFQAPGIPTQNVPSGYTYVMQNYAAPQTLPLGQYAANVPQVALPQYQAPQPIQQGGVSDVTGGNMDQAQLVALMQALQGQQNG